MIKTTIALFTTMVMVAAAWGADTTAPRLDKQDMAFAQSAMQGSLLAMRSSEIALTRGLNEGDQTFAKQMIDEHKKVHQELAAIAEKKGISQTTSLDQDHQDKLDALTKSDNKEFAEQYWDMQIGCHKDALSLFREQADDGKDPDLKAFAFAKLPTLQGHLDQAKKLAKQH